MPNISFKATKSDLKRSHRQITSAPSALSEICSFSKGVTIVSSHSKMLFTTPIYDTLYSIARAHETRAGPMRYYKIVTEGEHHPIYFKASIYDEYIYLAAVLIKIWYDKKFDVLTREHINFRLSFIPKIEFRFSNKNYDDSCTKLAEIIVDKANEWKGILPFASYYENDSLMTQLIAVENVDERRYKVFTLADI